MIIFMCKSYEHTIVITNRALVQGDFLKQMEKVIALHPYGVILREKDLADEAYEELAKNILTLCEREGVLCFLHSRIAIARKLGCEQMHLSIPALQSLREQERTVLRKDFRELSISCHSMEDMDYAVSSGATQIILGTIFETDCKKGLKGKGLDFVREICKVCPVPVYAIGGINMERLLEVMDAGAAGGCMMSGFMQLQTFLRD